MVSQLIAMVANTGFARFENPRLPAEFMPKYPDDEVPRAKSKRAQQDEFTRQMSRTMDRLIAYQDWKNG